jgi:pimeloyl-ACP methyl ester carboxylesterase
MDDLDEVRAAMGYEQINLYGGSWGTRFALIYLRRHGEHVRTAILNAVAPTALIYGLQHAAGAQSSLDLLITECNLDNRCSTSFPDLESEFRIVLERLGRAPATVIIEHPDTGVSVSVSFERAAFAEVIRYLLNSVDSSRYLPHLIHQAYLGSYEPLAQSAVEKNHFYRNALKTGMLLSVVCPGDVARINPGDIARLTNDTFMGDRRVRDTMAVCEIWPQPRLPATHGDPVQSDVPVLLWSGTMDPSNPPMWGEEAARHLTNGLHLVVPGCHVISGACFEEIGTEFLAEASVDSLDTSCVSGIRLPPFYRPGGG